MKKYFTTGLVILLPIIFTLMIVRFIINFLTMPFLNSTIVFFNKLHFIQNKEVVFEDSTLFILVSKALILLVILSITLLVGLVGKIFLVDSLFRISNYFLHRLPFVNRIYKACQEIVHRIFSSSKTFSQVVLVSFPTNQSLSIGFVTGQSIPLKQNEKIQDFISVFVPGTPNPSVGFMLILKKEQVIFINMKVEEAMKCIVSCGVLMPDFSIIKNSPLDRPLYEQEAAVS